MMDPTKPNKGMLEPLMRAMYGDEAFEKMRAGNRRRRLDAFANALEPAMLIVWRLALMAAAILGVVWLALRVFA